MFRFEGEDCYFFMQDSWVHESLTDFIYSLILDKELRYV